MDRRPLPATIDDLSTTALSVTGFDADGDSLTCTWMTTGGRIQGGGGPVIFVPPTVTGLVRIDVHVGDGRGGLTAGFVSVAVSRSPLPHNVAAVSFRPVACVSPFGRV